MVDNDVNTPNVIARAVPIQNRLPELPFFKVFTGMHSPGIPQDSEE